MWQMNYLKNLSEIIAAVKLLGPKTKLEMAAASGKIIFRDIVFIEHDEFAFNQNA